MNVIVKHEKERNVKDEEAQKGRVMLSTSLNDS